MPYSVQLYTVRDAVAANLPETIRRLAEIGFSQVEPFDLTNGVEELAAALAENGITAPTAHAPLLSADQDAIFAAANRLGIPTVVVPYVGPDQWHDPELIRGTAEGLNAAARKGAEYGVRVGYHNHYWEISSRIDGATALEFFAGILDREVVLEVDTYWVAIGGEDPAQLLERLGDRVVAIHIKDGLTGHLTGEPVGADDIAGLVQSQRLPAGSGDLDVWGIIGAANAAQVSVVEFDEYRGDIFEGIAESLRYLEAGAPVAEQVAI